MGEGVRAATFFSPHHRPVSLVCLPAHRWYVLLIWTPLAQAGHASRAESGLQNIHFKNDLRQQSKFLESSGKMPRKEQENS